ncbi:MAG: hypothetical protein AAF664_10520 [Planctomycetota bacterium]
MSAIPPSANSVSAISSIAATSRAAAKGGVSDDQQTRSTAQSTTTDSATPSGEVDAGDSSQDRHGDGRQVYDVFEQDSQDQSDEPAGDDSQQPTPDSSSGRLDLEM